MKELIFMTIVTGISIFICVAFGLTRTWMAILHPKSNCRACDGFGYRDKPLFSNSGAYMADVSDECEFCKGRGVVEPQINKGEEINAQYGMFERKRRFYAY